MKWFRQSKKEVEESRPIAVSKQPKKRLVQKMRFTVDFSHPRHQRILLAGIMGLVIFGIAILTGGLKTYEYTESAEFCGQTCHVMKSEFVRYKYSPHANVECAKCHIGPGTSFFVKSKIDGLRQVYAVIANTYSRPIKSPVHDLRPARETCEECHTPTSFKDNIIKTIVHYDNDKANTLVQSTLILKMGGWQQGTGTSEGIHWHITNPVYYIAADEERQVILWVGVEQDNGTLKEYFARDMLNVARESFVEKARTDGKVRLMDCIDCHNRTAHFIPAPEAAVDEAIKTGLISRELPYIRAKAVEVLTPSYASKAAADKAIEELSAYYQINQFTEQATATLGSLEIYQAQVDASLNAIKKIYSETNFSEMNLNWQTNPNNARHTPFPGCFRCHDGKHAAVDKSGNEVEIISVKCNLCHTVPIVGRGTDRLVEAPVVVGDVPDTHSDFRWTIEHRSITKSEEQECYDCHGRGFCNNGACHNLSHPPDMLYTHAEEYQKTGEQVCYTCHQDILCSRCHPGGIVANP